MIFPGHLSAGFLTTYAIISLAAVHAGGLGLNSVQTDSLLVIGTFLGDAPDVDILFYFLSKKTLTPRKLSAHRRYLTHAPLLWLLIGSWFYLMSLLLGLGIFWQIIGLLLWLCPWSHFICDSIDCGVMWLWPFSQKQFALYNPQARKAVPDVSNWSQLFRDYFKTPLAYIEILLTFLALWVLFSQYI